MARRWAPEKGVGRVTGSVSQSILKRYNLSCRPWFWDGYSMTTGELLTLQARQRRRLAQSAPFSPEWDVAMAALEDIEAALRVRASEASDASPSRPPGFGLRCRFDHLKLAISAAVTTLAAVLSAAILPRSQRPTIPWACSEDRRHLGASIRPRDSADPSHTLPRDRPGVFSAG
jgi:hypothetical protein